MPSLEVFLLKKLTAKLKSEINMYKHPLIDRNKMSPKEALQILIEGNQRFQNNLRSNQDNAKLINITKDAQHPFASVLSCSDSRAPVELIFDQAIGDIFSVRLAGNIASQNAIASLEFGLKYLKSKLLLVLGHSSCGAIKGCCDNVEDGLITNLLHQISPCLELETKTQGNRNSSNTKFVENLVELNVHYQKNKILQDSVIIRNLEKTGEIEIYAGVYDLATGNVRIV
jgi:carbonic anhydrase